MHWPISPGRSGSLCLSNSCGRFFSVIVRHRCRRRRCRCCSLVAAGSGEPLERNRSPPIIYTCAQMQLVHAFVFAYTRIFHSFPIVCRAHPFCGCGDKSRRFEIEFCAQRLNPTQSESSSLFGITHTHTQAHKRVSHTRVDPFIPKSWQTCTHSIVYTRYLLSVMCICEAETNLYSFHNADIVRSCRL